MPHSQHERALENRAPITTLFSLSGVAGFCCVALALAQASLIGLRWLTIALSVVGVLIAGSGAWSRRAHWHSRDRVWLAVSGTLCGLIIFLICFAPGVLNSRWAIDRTVPQTDPNELTVVPRDKAMQRGRLLSKDETVDAATEALRQDDVVVRIESAKIGPVSGRGDKLYLLVQFRVVNSGQGQSISLEGFNESPPTLSDSAGRTLAFIEPRLKQIRNRSVIFAEWSGRQSVEIPPRGSQDVMLIFESPLVGNSLQLEVGSAAWGRKGVCRFRIAGIHPAKT